MAQQLRALGLNARIAPLPPRQHGDRECPMPADFTVMLYVPRTRAEFYGRRAFEQLMERLRDRPIRYIVVGGGEIDVPPGVAVENLGWRDDLMSVYERVSALIRYTATDGLSLMVLEALTFGRHVLWTQEFPFTNTVRRYEDMEREIRRLFDAHQRGELHPQCEAADAIRKHYDSARCIRAIASYWEDVLEKPASARLALDPS
jgi:glycosyltransferase involved in cell wall biosynthesis